MMYEEAKKNSIVSIEIVIGGYYGKGEFRARIKINAKITPGRNIKRIFRLAHAQCKNDNGEILGNTPLNEFPKSVIARTFSYAYFFI